MFVNLLKTNQHWVFLSVCLSLFSVCISLSPFCTGVFERGSETETAKPAPSGGAEKDRSSAEEIQSSAGETSLYQSETRCTCHSGTHTLLALLVSYLGTWAYILTEALNIFTAQDVGSTEMSRMSLIRCSIKFPFSWNSPVIYFLVINKMKLNNIMKIEIYINVYKLKTMFI